MCAGLLSLQSSVSLADFSGFGNIQAIGTLVIAFLGNNMADLDGFNALHQASMIILTRNLVSDYVRVKIMNKVAVENPVIVLES